MPLVIGMAIFYNTNDKNITKIITIKDFNIHNFIIILIHTSISRAYVHPCKLPSKSLRNNISRPI